jgi:hypothetical protein
VLAKYLRPVAVIVPLILLLLAAPLLRVDVLGLERRVILRKDLALSSANYLYGAL